MKDELEKLIQNQQIESIDKAKVLSVGATHCKVQSLTTDKIYFKCSLNAVIDNDVQELKIVPELNSVVVIAVFKTGAAIIQTSKVKSFSYTYENTVFELSAAGLLLTRNGQNLNESINVLQDQVMKLCDALSATVVNAGYGVTPNTALIAAIKAEVAQNKLNINQLIKQ